MKLKKPKSLTTYVPKRGRVSGVTMSQERELRRMAGLIGDKEHLMRIIMDARPEMRAACLERLRPYLRANLRDVEFIDCDAR